MKKMVKWFEIIATDIDRAVKFYQSLFKIELELCDCGDEKMAFFPGKEGAISYAQGFTPSRQGTILYLDAVEPIEQMVKRVKGLGGEILLDVTKIEAENAGSFALILDTEGNRIGLHSNE